MSRYFPEFSFFPIFFLPRPGGHISHMYICVQVVFWLSFSRQTRRENGWKIGGCGTRRGGKIKLWRGAKDERACCLVLHVLVTGLAFGDLFAFYFCRAANSLPQSVSPRVSRLFHSMFAPSLSHFSLSGFSQLAWCLKIYELFHIDILIFFFISCQAFVPVSHVFSLLFSIHPSLSAMMHDYVNRHFYTMNTVLGYYEVRFYFLFACRANLFVLFSFFIFYF